MLAAMDDDTLGRIVGPGITHISCMAIEGSYDHKRHHAARHAGRPHPPEAPVPVWDFVVQRADGSWLRFHPEQTKRKVAVAAADFDYEREGPYAGRGRSDGPGTYRNMLAQTYNDGGTFKATEAEREANRERARARGRGGHGGAASTRGRGGGYAPAAPAPQFPAAAAPAAECCWLCSGESTCNLSVELVLGAKGSGTV